MEEETKRKERENKTGDTNHKLYLLLRAYNELSKKVDRLERELEAYRGRVTAEESNRKTPWENEQSIYETSNREGRRAADTGKSLEKTSEDLAKPSKRADKKKNSQKTDGKYGEKTNKKQHLGKTIGTIAFYSFLVLMILGAVLVRSSSDGSPRSLAGFSAMLVLSGSMQSEIPKGSLVINRSVDPETLKVGDDITYLASSTTTVTHRIVDITGSYEDTGERAFQTQGIENPEPDEALVPAGNVVGKVIWHSHILGIIAETITDNFPVIIFFIVVIVILINVLWRINRKGDEEEISDDESDEEEKADGKS